MISVPVRDFRAKFSHYMQLIRDGEIVMINNIAIGRYVVVASPDMVVVANNEKKHD